MNITTQNRIARQLDGFAQNISGLIQDIGGFSMLQRFDYPETWSYTGIIPSSDAKFGENCVYFPNTDSRATVTNTTGMFNLSPFGNCEIECFVKFSEMNSEDECNILKFGDLALTLSDSILRLSSSTFDIDKAATDEITPNVWHHILLRITGGYAYLFVDGSEVLKAYIPSQTAITPEQVEFGGYVGYMDEFVFRRNAGSGAPTVPTEAYETSSSTKIPTKDAPVTRVAWSAEGLPEGLKLSESGQLTGHPTTAGSYDVAVQVTTNWGTASKTVSIVVQ